MVFWPSEATTVAKTGAVGRVAVVLLVLLSAVACQQTQANLATNQVAESRSELWRLQNSQRPFGVALWSGMAGTPLIGQPLRLLMQSNGAGYATLFHVGTTGEPAILAENRFLSPATAAEFPGPADPSELLLAPPPGTNSFFLVVTRQPNSWVMPRAAGSGMISRISLTYPQFVQLLEEQLRGLPASDWEAAVLNLDTPA